MPATPRLDGRLVRGIRRRAGKLAQANARAAGKCCGTPKRRVTGLRGDLLCIRCKQLRPTKMFHVDRERPAGRCMRCRPCAVATVMAWKARRRVQRQVALMQSRPIFPIGPVGPLPPLGED